MKLSPAQQEVINCLGDGYSMIQAYDTPPVLEGCYRHQLGSCTVPTKNKLLSLNLIFFSESGGIKFYRLTPAGKAAVNGKPTDWAQPQGISSDSGEV
jgi:hypothetical protein